MIKKLNKGDTKKLVWSLETIIALNKRRQEEFDRTHPEEAEKRYREDADESGSSGSLPTPLHVPHPNGSTPKQPEALGVSKPPLVLLPNLRDTLLRLRI